ncbi:WXG100 family type VII secretion target [Spirillospora sp. CA-253888]
MGHPKNLPPPSTKEVKVDHGALQDIAKVLRKDLQALRDARYKEQIDDAHPTSNALGNYTAGQSLHTTVKAARDVIGPAFANFVTSYEAVINALENSEKNYRKADDRSEENVRRRGRMD